MSTFKKAKIVMLPSNGESNIQQNKFNKLFFSEQEKSYSDTINQHLYIISYIEKPDNGDYYIIDDIPEVLKNNGLVFIDDSCGKVIATTDKTLSQTSRTEIPQPSQQFIQKYIEEYNRGNIITDVLVECENKFEGKEYVDELDAYGYDKIKSILKINPKDNNIIIKIAKDSWSREEVDRLLDEQASKTTAEMLEKFKDRRSKEDEDLRIAFENFACAVYDENYNKDTSFRKRAELMSKKWIKENLI